MVSRVVCFFVLCVMFEASPFAAPEDPRSLPAPTVPLEELVLPDVSSQTFELGVFAGAMTVEDFGADLAQGFRLTVHANEFLFIDMMSLSGKISDKGYASQGIFLFGSGREKTVSQNSVLVGFNVFPGEVFFGNRRAFISSTYFVAGAGEVSMLQNDFPALVLGMGLSLRPNNWSAFRFESLLTEYESDLLGFKKFAHNIYLGVGASVLF